MVKRQIAIEERIMYCPQDPLTKLAIKYGTDKWGYHSYTPLYHRLLSPIKHKIKSILELGVLHGSSLRMWRDYFPHATILGVDNAPVLPPERTRVLEADLSNRNHYSRIKGEYDVIIDDASHKVEDQLLSLEMLINQCNFYYIIEDVRELAEYDLSQYGDVQLYDTCGEHNDYDDRVIVIKKQDTETL